MLLPKSFGRTVQESYQHLHEHVQIWDVSVERQVEVAGPDAARLVQWMTPRDLRRAKVGRCYYVPIVDADGRHAQRSGPAQARRGPLLAVDRRQRLAALGQGADRGARPGCARHRAGREPPGGAGSEGGRGDGRALRRRDAGIEVLRLHPCRVRGHAPGRRALGLLDAGRVRDLPRGIAFGPCPLGRRDGGRAAPLHRTGRAQPDRLDRGAGCLATAPT